MGSRKHFHVEIASSFRAESGESTSGSFKAQSFRQHSCNFVNAYENSTMGVMSGGVNNASPIELRDSDVYLEHCLRSRLHAANVYEASKDQKRNNSHGSDI